MSAVRSLSVEKRTHRGHGENDAIDPLQKWRRGERYHAEHRGNMNVINISGKKSELDRGR
jgi:Ni/Co efflux regulator RcnB